jgi:putative tryptophan/tyrosine transport system substrate-binding protein
MNRFTRRRALLAGGALAASNLTLAQSAGRRYRLGWLSSSNLWKEPHYIAFVQRLGELGLVEGRNLAIDRRDGGNRLERLPAMAAELAKLRCDVFFGGGTEANLVALLNASRDTPIVFVAVDFDPVATGDVASLARPGGRVTGVTALQSTLPAKRLELLKEMLPGATRVAVLTNDESTAQLVLTQGTARRLGIDIHVVDLKRPPFDYEGGFADAVRAKAQALVVLGSGLWVPARRRIHELALKARLPAIFHQSLWVETGGLMSYGFNFPTMYRRGADMVAHILRGARVGEIPMEQPTAYELAVNLKTARALGIEVPQSILIRADKVVE